MKMMNLKNKSVVIFIICSATFFLFIIGNLDVSATILSQVQHIREGDVGVFSFKDRPDTYFSKIKHITARELTNPYIYPKTNGKSRELQRRGFWWTDAFLANAMTLCHETDLDKSDLDNLVKFYDKYIKPDGNFRRNDILEYLDSAMHGVPLLYLYSVTVDKRYLKSAEQIYNFLRMLPKSDTGIIPYRASQREQILVDTLGMICPFLAYYGKTFDNSAALKLAENQVLDFLNKGVDPNTGLPYHGYASDGKGYLGILGWGRGVGWYLLGLVGTLEYLPENNASREQMIMALKKLVKTLEISQKDNGAWSWVITNQSAEDDMSATAIIAYTIEKAIKLRLLPKTYYSILDRAYSALTDKTTRDGFLIKTSGESGGPGKYSSTFGHYPWGQGPATAFTCLLVERRNQADATKYSDQTLSKYQ